MSYASSLKKINTDLPHEFHGDAPSVVELLRQVTLAAKSTAPILLQGEVGTGKAALAKHLHNISTMRHGPFVSLCCAELEKRDAEAAIIRAKGGTLYLEHVIDMPLLTQIYFLKAVDEKAFRIIAGTAHSLEKAAANGSFRNDLLYRLKVISLDVPPLRKRKQDLSILWQKSLVDACLSEKRTLPDCRPQTLSLLLKHDWPGNIYELRNTARHAASQFRDEVILPENLPPALLRKEEVQTDIRIPGMRLSDLERVAILQTYEATGNAKTTAKILDISVRKIHYRLKEYKTEGFLDDTGTKPAGGLIAAHATPHRPRLVLAEDDDQIRWSLAAMLEDEGYDVLALSSGSAVLEHLGAVVLKENGAILPDVIVTDVRMSGLNGMRLLEGVRANGWNIPVILISAFGDDEMRSQAAHFSATAFLDKPLDLDELQRVLHQSAPVTQGFVAH